MAVLVGAVMVYALLIAGDTMAEDYFIKQAQITAVIDELAATHGETEQPRIARCTPQVAQLWREDDGTAEEFAAFCRDNYIADPELRRQTADRYEAAFASIFGHLREIGKDLNWHLSVETGPILPIDHALARLSPGAHVIEDMFKTKIAFIALLNYPLYTLDERLRYGPAWTREEWAQARLVESFAARVPPEVSQKISDAFLAGDNYISHYNIYMHHLLTPDGERPFPEGLRLITHWNLRDELKSQYAEPDGLAKQEMIYEVMLKIIRQEIPATVINNPGVDWQLSTDEVTISPVVDGELPAGWTPTGSPGEAVDNSREPDTRYRHWLDMFDAQRAVDPYYPTMPTLIERRFQRDREMPEEEVERIFKSIMSSEVMIQMGWLIEIRLGRKLRPFDIWYDGFKARGSIPEEELNRMVREKYPTVEAFQNGLPQILSQLGFDNRTAEFLVSRIAVDPSRGVGHATGPGRKVDQARLRTRIPATGMDYKGYSIAIHEFGHNVEQVLSLNKVDHTLLRGVPNAAFTEGFAFVFQSRDLPLLGLSVDDPAAELLKTLDNLWVTYEIIGASLVDMKAWHWLYDNPAATPAEFRNAVITIAKDIWNEYYAPVIGVTDSEILAVYSHMIDYSLYLPSYPLGHIIAFQIEQHMKQSNIASEMERMCKMGSVTPDLWMKNAVGGSISTQPMLEAADKAIRLVAE
ncbi:hypothetical protein ACFLQW_03075 [Candidatus Zixiibacteriota bacterium]